MTGANTGLGVSSCYVWPRAQLTRSSAANRHPPRSPLSSPPHPCRAQPGEGQARESDGRRGDVVRGGPGGVGAGLGELRQRQGVRGEVCCAGSARHACRECGDRDSGLGAYEGRVGVYVRAVSAKGLEGTAVAHRPPTGSKSTCFPPACWRCSCCLPSPRLLYYLGTTSSLTWLSSDQRVRTSFYGNLRALLNPDCSSFLGQLCREGRAGLHLDCFEHAVQVHSRSRLPCFV